MWISLSQVEGQLLLWIQEFFRQPWLDPVVSLYTRLGDHGLIWIVACALMLLWPKTRRAGIAGAWALILSLLCTNVILKHPAPSLAGTGGPFSPCGGGGSQLLSLRPHQRGPLLRGNLVALSATVLAPRGCGVRGTDGTFPALCRRPFPHRRPMWDPGGPFLRLGWPEAGTGPVKRSGARPSLK